MFANGNARASEGLLEAWNDENDGVLPMLGPAEVLLTGLITPLPILWAMCIPFGAVMVLLGHPVIALVFTLSSMVADTLAQRAYRFWREQCAAWNERALLKRLNVALSLRACVAVGGATAAALLTGAKADLVFLAIISGFLLCVATAQGSLSRSVFWASAGPVFAALVLVVVADFPLPTAAILLTAVALLAGMLALLAGGAARLLGDWSDMREKNNSLIMRLKAEREAAELAREEARQASQAKASFLATMSHEIRTPMNGVLGMAQLLRRSVAEGEQRRQVDTLIHSGEFLLSILNDILDISKIDAGKLELAERPEPVRVVIEDLIALWLPTATEKGLVLKLEMGDDVPAFVRIDARRLRQVLFNLIGNAMKFTEAGGVTLTVGAVSLGEDRIELRLAVRDTGIGIDPAVLPTLFERFSQVDQSTSRAYGGAGLGLSISRQLVDLMGGYVTAESRAGEGACFRVALPLTLAEAPARAEPAMSEAAGDRLDDGLSVLIVDDNPVNLAVLDQILGAFGHQVTRAVNGPDALDLAATRPFDLILLDIQMPGMTGVEALAKLRANDGPNRGARVLAVTADVLTRGRTDYLQLGFSGHVSKPIQVGALAAEMAAVMDAPNAAVAAVA